MGVQTMGFHNMVMEPPVGRDSCFLTVAWRKGYKSFYKDRIPTEMKLSYFDVKYGKHISIHLLVAFA